MSNETAFLEANGLTVTNSRFVVNGQTYAMSNVTSVKQGVTPASKVGPIIMIIVGIMFMTGGEAGPLLIGLAFIAGGIAWWIKAKPTYSVMLSTSAGEAQALASKDRAYIESVISALNQAIIHRG